MDPFGIPGLYLGRFLYPHEKGPAIIYKSAGWWYEDIFLIYIFYSAYNQESPENEFG